MSRNFGSPFLVCIASLDWFIVSSIFCVFSMQHNRLYYIYKSLCMCFPVLEGERIVINRRLYCEYCGALVVNVNEHC